MYKIIKFFLITLAVLFLLVFLYLVKIMFFNFEEVKESYYYITSTGSLRENTLKLKYTWEYYGDLVIDLNETDENLCLKKIKIFYQNNLAGEIYLNKKLEKTLHKDRFSYSVKDDLLRILGEENEKYNITDSEDWRWKFILMLEIEDIYEKRHLIEDYATIRFQRKGTYYRSIINYF